MRKLYRIWWLVLLRGLVEGALALPLLMPELRTEATLTRLVAGTALAGGFLEMCMFFVLRDHAFRPMLRLFGLSGVFIGSLMFFLQPLTLAMLLVGTGLWIAIRGFTALWIGLSIVDRPLDRWIPAAAGLLSLLFGLTLLWLDVPFETFAFMISIYALGSTLAHLAVAIRMRLVGPLQPEANP